MTSEVHRYKLGDIAVTVLSDGFRNAVARHLPRECQQGGPRRHARGRGPADRPHAQHLCADRAGDVRQARADRYRQRRGGVRAGQGRARPAAAQSRRRRHRPQCHRPGRDLAFPRRPRERAARRRQPAGVSQCRDQGAGDGVDVLDGRRRDEPRAERPHDGAVPQQPPGVRRARPQGDALRLGRGGRHPA